MSRTIQTVLGPKGAAGLLLPALFLLVAACQDSPTSPPSLEDQLRTGHALLPDGSQARLEARAEAFRPGGQVELVLTNTGSAPFGYNLCSYALERREGEGWSPLLDQGQICLAVLYSLQPGGEARYETELPSTLAPGEYRFRVGLYLERTNQMRDQASGSFQVE